MKRQLPRSISLAGIILALLAAIWVLGKMAPESEAAKEEREAQEALSKLNVPDFTATMPDGKPLRLADYKGQVVLLNFWATWCGPCRQEIPDLIKLQEKYGPKGFTVIGLSEDDGPQPVDAYAKQIGMNYPVAMEPSGLGRQLQVSGLPTSFLIDRNGKVVYMTPGVYPDISMFDLWAPKIEKVL